LAEGGGSEPPDGGPPGQPPPTETPPLPDDVIRIGGRSFDDIEREVFGWALRRHAGSRRRAARALNNPRPTSSHKVKRYRRCRKGVRRIRWGRGPVRSGAAAAPPRRGPQAAPRAAAPRGTAPRAALRAPAQGAASRARLSSPRLRDSPAAEGTPARVAAVAVAV